jgi:hypothetical protein
MAVSAMSAKDGGLAFPKVTGGHVEECSGSGHQNMSFVTSGGMTLRDYFAGQALAGLASRFDSAMVKKYLDGAHDAREVIVAYLLADAMLQERDR